MTSLFRRHPRGRPPHPDVLTPAEWRVLEELRRGYSNPEIAERLGLALNTVKTHVSSMLSKLELHDRRELADWQGRPASVSRSALGGLLSFFVSKRGAFAATAATGAVVAAFVLAMYAGRDEMTQPQNAAPPLAAEVTPTVAATPGVVSLADLNLPPGRILYSCERRWCAIGADGRGNAELSTLPQNVVEIAPSPDGARVAYLEMAPDGRWLGVANIDGTRPRRLTEARAVHDPVPPVWSPDGRTIYVEHGPSIEGIGGPTAILAVDAASGEVRVLVDSETSGYGPAVSPDGTTVAFSSDLSANLDVFTVRAAGGQPERLTTGPSAETSPAWTPDGRIVYVGNLDGRSDVLVMNADGSGRRSLTGSPPGGFVSPIGHHPPPISPDGNWVAFQSERTGSIELYIARTDGSGAVKAMTAYAPNGVGIPVWSPDSSYLAYSAALNDQRGMRITRVADGATAYLGDGLPAAWIP